MNLGNKQILKIIREAKDSYVNDKGFPTGMCWHLKLALYNNGINVAYNKEIPKYIPMFVPEFFGLHVDVPYDYHWWILSDKESRIKAFDKLIKYYENNK